MFRGPTQDAPSLANRVGRESRARLAANDRVIGSPNDPGTDRLDGFQFIIEVTIETAEVDHVKIEQIVWCPNETLLLCYPRFDHSTSLSLFTRLSHRGVDTGYAVVPLPSSLPLPVVGRTLRLWPH